MANPQLSVNLTANIEGFERAMRDAGVTVSNTGSTVNTVTQNISRNISNLNRNNLTAFNNSLAAGTLQVTRFGQAGAQAQANLSRFSVGANQAGFALTNLGRVAQDAPFGFIGIQNNLNPLLESFQRLRAETGSNGAALRALGQSLIGPAGLGLALSVVSSAILFYQQYQQRANKTTNEAKKATDEYIKSLDSVTASNLKGGKSAQDELANLKLLYGAYQNANASLKVRKDAYKQLQDEYPRYFGNIKFEQEASAKTTSAYNELTQAILATARARAAADKIAENEGRKLENEQKILDLQKQQIKEVNTYGRAQAKVEKENLAVRQEANMLTTAQRKTIEQSNNALGSAQKIQGQINNLKTDTNKLDEQNGRLVTYVNGQLEKGAKLTGSLGEAREKAAKVALFAGRSLTNISGPDNLGTSLTASLPNISAKLKEFVSENQKALASLRYEFDYTDDEIASFISNYGINAQQLLDKTIALNKGVSEIVNNGLITTFGSLAEGIGTALANGASVADAAGQAMLSSLGGVLVQLGQLAIATGVGIKAVQTALKSLNPVIAITAGVALVALGSVFKAKAASIGGGGQSGAGSTYKPIRGFATGGSNIAGGMALVGERGPELVNLPTGSDVFNNAKTNRILQDSNRGNVIINGSLAVGLDELYIRLEQTGKRLNRNGR